MTSARRSSWRAAVAGVVGDRVGRVLVGALDAPHARARSTSRRAPPARCARAIDVHHRHGLDRDARPRRSPGRASRASVPSRIALATSVTSARVGREEVTIDSSIWVAVITGRASSPASAMIRFWTSGTSSMPARCPGRRARPSRSRRRAMIASALVHRLRLLDLRDQRQVGVLAHVARCPRAGARTTAPPCRRPSTRRSAAARGPPRGRDGSAVELARARSGPGARRQSRPARPRCRPRTPLAHGVTRRRTEPSAR